MITAVIPQDGFPGLPLPAGLAVPHAAADEGPTPSAEEDSLPSGAVGPADDLPSRNQPAIWDAEPEPRQLALIPDPDAWEADRPPPAGTRTRDRGDRGGPSAQRRRRTAIPSPGQLSLF